MTGEHKGTSLADRLQFVGRILELPNRFVWCIAPMEDEQGRTHVFFSHWDAKKGMGGWLNGCEIGHAVAARPEGPYEVKDVALAPRAGMWDSTTVHNPHIHKVGDLYALFHMGNCNGKTDTKRIGLATSHSLDGPWTRYSLPLLEPGLEGEWDDHCTTNPAVLQKGDEFWLYYKSWNTHDYVTSTHPSIRGNRKYGLAVAKSLAGPYVKHERNPVIDLSNRGNNCQFEDAFAWQEDAKVKLIARDMGFFDHESGLCLESNDGIHFAEPTIAYHSLSHYFPQPPTPAHLKRHGRLERPQLLLRDGKPAYLFGASQGGKAGTSSGMVFRIAGG